MFARISTNKARVPFFLTMLLLIFVLSSCVPTSEQITKKASKIVGKLTKDLQRSQKIKVAVVGFAQKDGRESDLEKYFSEKFTQELVSTRGFVVIARKELPQVIQELRKQKSWMIDPGTAKEIGKIKGVDAIIIGVLTYLLYETDITTKVIDTEDGTILAHVSDSMIRMDRILMGISIILLALISGIYLMRRYWPIDCKLCGIKVRRKDTFTCRTCGISGICRHYCYDSNYRQCIECTSKQLPSGIVAEPETNRLAGLYNPGSPLRIRIWSEYGERPARTRDIAVVPQKEFSQYKIGDNVEIRFQSSEDCYVYFFNIGPAGNVTQLFPNKFCSDNHVQGGQIYKFPGERANFKWVLKKPMGTEIIKAFATKIPVDTLKFVEIDDQFSKINSHDIGVISRSIKDMLPDQWAEASCTLVVHSLPPDQLPR